MEIERVQRWVMTGLMMTTAVTPLSVLGVLPATIGGYLVGR